MLNQGTKLGPYEIVAPLGAGGMGEVYRARDTRLNREVALKVLPEAFARDAERLARFRREAQVLASLNHPNIAAIYGFEDSGATHALVMELVDGPTLAERVKQGAIPIDEVLPMAKQICEALEYAHERGIVHRDLKPSNVKISGEGNAKVLDFGLAKAIQGETPAISIENSPTLSAVATRAGFLLGTAAYMAPEQAKEKPADRRADIWAFGVTLFEILSGKRLFTGETMSETLSAVLTKDPDWSLLPSTTPPRMRELLQRCLKKDPRQRLQSIGDARITLGEILSGATAQHESAAAGRVMPRLQAWRGAVPWAIAAAAIIVAAVLGAELLRSPGLLAVQPVLKSLLMLPNNDQVKAGDISLALSPDGTELVFVGIGTDGTARLWLRPMAGGPIEPLTGTEGASYPFWSPDSRFLGFFAGGKLKKLDVRTGSIEVLAEAPAGRGGSWSSSGEIVYAPSAFSNLYEITVVGGAPIQVTFAQDKGDSDRLPYFLPDGRHVIFSAIGHSYLPGNMFVLDLKTKAIVRLREQTSNVAYASPGYLLFYQDGSLMAQPFDATHLRFTGEAVPIAKNVTYRTNRWAAQFSVSETGELVYLTGPTTVNDQLTWFSLDGKKLGTVGDPGSYWSAAISPSGDRALLTEWDEQAGYGLWMMDLAHGVLRRFVLNHPGSNTGIWTPDGREAIFTGPKASLMKKPADGSSGATPVSKVSSLSFHSLTAETVSPDDRLLLFGDASSGRFLIGIQPLVSKAEAYSWSPASVNEREPSFSPDGHWLSYLSDESGTEEMYVAAFPGPGGKWQVSSGGAVAGGWIGGGRALLYVTPKRQLMEVDVTPGGNTLKFSAPHQIFGGQTLPGVWELLPDHPLPQFTWVTPDGKKLLLPVPVSQPTDSTSISLVVNRTALLKKQ